VLPASSVVRIQHGLDPLQAVFVTFDGQDSISLHSGDVVTVERALVPLRLVKAATRTYFDVLRRKLKWAER
jgi:NAD kinase